MWRQLHYLTERKKSFFDAFGFGRQSEILQDDHRLVATKFSDRGLTILGSENVVTLETPLELAQETGVVLDDQQFATRFAHKG